MNELVKSFLLQVMFLTRIPVPVRIKFEDKIFAKGIITAPVVGLVIGFLTCGIYSLANMTGKQLPAIIIAVAAEIIITGGLHLDGLADTFDGIFSNRPKEKILQIMKDSRIGTNGAIALILTICSKIAILFSLHEGYILEYLIIMPVISRMNIAWTAGLSRYARKEGMAASVVKYTGVKEIIIASAITVILSVIFLKFAALFVIPALVLFVFLFTRYIEKKISGITGDTIGAVIELSEIAVLFVLLIYEAVFVYNV
jgi:adenosylcobinamide-GDP ribazoletransferase